MLPNGVRQMIQIRAFQYAIAKYERQVEEGRANRYEQQHRQDKHRRQTNNRRYLRNQIKPLIERAIAEVQAGKTPGYVVKHATRKILDLLFEYDPNL